jgi:hypothetical protein
MTASVMREMRAAMLGKDRDLKDELSISSRLVSVGTPAILLQIERNSRPASSCPESENGRMNFTDCARV